MCLKRETYLSEEGDALMLMFKYFFYVTSPPLVIPRPRYTRTWINTAIRSSVSMSGGKAYVFIEGEVWVLEANGVFKVASPPA